MTIGAPSLGRVQAIWALAVAETLVWAGIYYVFAALALRWEQDLGWPKEALAGGFTLALLVSALAAPVAGAAIDRGHGPAVLSLSALAGAVLLALLSAVQSVTSFYLIWAALGAAMAGCLYEPCFAFVTRTTGDGARGAITRITLVAGLASTLCFPLAALAAEAWGWRASLWVFAALTALGAALFWAAGGVLERGAQAERAAAGADRAASRQALRRALGSPVFWLIALAFSTMALNHGVLLNHLLAILDDRGLDAASAVLVASLIGPMQVTGRIVLMRFGAEVSSLTLTAISFGTVALAALIFLTAGATLSLIVIYAVGQGAGYGVISILRPVVAAELLGRQGFGAISGLLATPYLICSAAAPLIGALLWRAGGDNGADWAIGFALTAALGGLAAFAIAASVALRREASAEFSDTPQKQENAG